jgi:hypothetical protein
MNDETTVTARTIVSTEFIDALLMFGAEESAALRVADVVERVDFCNIRGSS